MWYFIDQILVYVKNDYQHVYLVIIKLYQYSHDKEYAVKQWKLHKEPFFTDSLCGV